MQKLNKQSITETVIYNFVVSNQELSLLYRGKGIPSHFDEYDVLWSFADKERKTETIIIEI